MTIPYKAIFSEQNQGDLAGFKHKLLIISNALLVFYIYIAYLIFKSVVFEILL